MRHGEIEGYARWVTYGEGVNFTPLWRSLTQPITQISPGVFQVPFDRPTGAAFTNSVLSWQFSPNDGLSVANQYGWTVKDNTGSFVTANPTISGMNIILTTTGGSFPVGGNAEIAYAMYGPGGTNPGIQSGVWGNLAMAGPPSVLVPGLNVNAWAWQFAEDITT
jgi:hypothetical protein